MLTRAKARGLVPAITPLLDRLESQLGFFISPKLRAEVLKEAGEGS